MASPDERAKRRVPTGFVLAIHESNDCAATALMTIFGCPTNPIDSSRALIAERVATQAGQYSRHLRECRSGMQ